MKTMRRLNFFEEDGDTTSFALILIFSIFLILLPVSYLVVSQKKLIDSYSEFYRKRESMEKLLEAVFDDFQIIADYDEDSPESVQLQDIISKYSKNSIDIKDVSTGINLVFMDKNFSESAVIRRILETDNEKFISGYGWINKKLVDEKLMVIDGSVDVSIFQYQFVNNLPLYNVNFMEREFLEAVLEFCHIQNFKEKANEIYTYGKAGTLENKNLEAILKVDKNDKIMSFFGTKTNFWKIHIEDACFRCEAVFAGIPDQTDENQHIRQYILVEKSIKEKRA